MLKSTGGGSLWAQIWGCSAWSRPMMFGSAESEHPRLTNDEIISDVFQSMLSQSTNVTDRQTDGQTDRQTTCDRNTALCTKVHRAVTKLPTVSCFVSADRRLFCFISVSRYVASETRQIQPNPQTYWPNPRPTSIQSAKPPSSSGEHTVSSNIEEVFSLFWTDACS